MDAAALGRELLWAANSGQDERVVTLLGQGADIDYRVEDDDGWTALMYASICGHTSTVKLLLERGANANLTSNDNRSALNYSASHGRLEITQLLVSHGADIESRGYLGRTPLIYAARNGNLAICEFLLSKGADLRAVDNHGQTALTLYGCDVDDTPLSPATIALHRAALETAFADGPHPTQVARRNWERRRWLLQVTAENGYRPLSHRVAAMPAVDPAAAIPPIPFDTAEQRHAYLLSQVLSNEGLHGLIVRML